jgi:hypothetical protein
MANSDDISLSLIRLMCFTMLGSCLVVGGGVLVLYHQLYMLVDKKKKKKKPFKIPFLRLIVYTRYDKRKKQESFHKKNELSQLSCDIFRSY